VIGRVFDFVEVKRVGKWLLILAVPMTLIMVLQFRGAPSVGSMRVRASMRARSLTREGACGHRERSRSSQESIFFYALGDGRF
jgi:hypothetical protein